MTAGARIPEHLLEDLRARLPIETLVSRHVVLKRGGAWRSGLCPFHQERKPSFTVHPQRRTFHCFGCGAHGDIFGFTMRIEGCDFRTAVARVAAEAGVTLDIEEAASAWRAPKPAPGRRDDVARDRADATDFAASLWRRSAPIDPDGPVAAYLAGRGLWPLPEAAHQVLRQARIRHKDIPGDVLHWVMLARVDAPDGTLRAVHRTYLAPKDGGGWGKLPGVEAKLALGPLPGAAIRLFPAGEALGVAEGIETALAAHRLTGLPVWACISATILEAVEIPFEVAEVVVFADRDAPREKPPMPEGQGVFSARRLAQRLRGLAVNTDIRTPLPPAKDYADVWAARQAKGEAA